MANEYYAYTSDLTNIANAIRTKGGTSAALSFPTGFINAINAFPNGSSYLPEFTYTGEYSLTDEGSNKWYLILRTSGTLKFTKLNSAVDIFLVGGGGGGAVNGESKWWAGGGGGGGGYITRVSSISPSLNTNYTATIGTGGAAGVNGGTTSIFSRSASGGNAAPGRSGGNGGSGGGGGGYTGGTGGTGGTNGGAGTTNHVDSIAGTGQGVSTVGYDGLTYAAGGGGGAGMPDSGNGFGTAGKGGAGGGGHGGNIGTIVPTNTQITSVQYQKGNTGGNAVPGTGSGGGGGSVIYKSMTGNPGGSGASGIIMIRSAR